jgi:leucyl-tRNA synthetase
MKRIESKWQKKWQEEKLYEPDFEHASSSRRKPFYNLMMFPYLSAEGLHIGAVRTFSGVDVYGRFKRMQGHDVFEPIGLDGFGIHSENYALKIGKHPAEHAKESEKSFYRQLAMIGNGFAWEERLETYNPAYYQWTQWIFVQMFKHGLAYRKKALVNWCPSCKTVLADEQVIDRECERCGSEVIKKELEQWFFKITDYAERLLQHLDTIDWSERIKIAQRNWIGKSEGALITFPLHNIAGQEDDKHVVEIFTTRPDTIFGATYIVVSPERAQRWLDVGWRASDRVREYITQALAKRGEKDTAEEKTGVETELRAVNPVNGEKIPVWISDYVLGDVGTGAIMAVPAHDQRDFAFAKKYNLPIRIVVCPHYPAKTCPMLDEAYEGEGHLVASGPFDGMASQEAKEAITTFVKGSKKVQYRLRDWLISRQRYWGPPIPLVFCENCAEKIKMQKSKIKIKEEFNKGELENPGWIAVSEEDLPVELPYVENFRPTGTEQSPLASVETFWKTTCPKCGGPARRETDVSDSFLDSSWYYLGYLILGNQKSKIKNQKFGNDILKKWLPVNMYIGGAEHAVLHLLYSRFVAMALFDWGFVHFEEPFTTFRAHGLITKDGAKMSKSKGNVVSPDEVIKMFGIDAVRMFLLFLAPFEESGDYRESGIKGITRFLNRVWNFVVDKQKRMTNNQDTITKQIPNSKFKIQKTIHKTIKKVTEDIEGLHYNTAISALMILLNAFEKEKENVSTEDVEVFLKLLAPFAPFLTEECWRETLGHEKSIHVASWPAFDPQTIEEQTISLVIQINGKVRDTADAEKGISQEDAERLARARDRIKPYLEGKQIRKTIFVADRLINFVL